MESNEEERFWLRSSKPLKFGEQAATYRIFVRISLMNVSEHIAHTCVRYAYVFYIFANINFPDISITFAFY